MVACQARVCAANRSLNSLAHTRRQVIIRYILDKILGVIFVYLYYFANLQTVTLAGRVPQLLADGRQLIIIDRSKKRTLEVYSY